jgi:hypothetical protein
MEILLKLIIVPLIAAGLSHFWGAKSNQKRLSPEMLLCRTRPLPCKSAKTWAAKSCPTSFAHGLRFSKYCYALPAHMATIVLPDFGRSSSADGKKKIKPQNVNNLKIRHWLVRVAQTKLNH